jgi:phage-related baseplate assembly protein
MSQFPAINLAALPQPSAVSVPSIAAILQARLQYFQTLWAAAQASDPSLPNYDVETLYSDPGVMLQTTDTYRETLVYSAINDAVLQTNLAWASGTNLDAIGVGLYATPRGTGELDGPYKARIQLAWENQTCGGSYGGYRYEALSAAPVDLADVQVYGYNDVPSVLAKGEVRIVCLGANASGVPSASVLAEVRAACAPKARVAPRKLNDMVNVVAANPANYNVVGTLYLAHGADPATVLSTQLSSLATFLAARRAIGVLIKPGDVEAVLGFNQPGLVVRADVRAPGSPVGGDKLSAPILNMTQVGWAYADEQ